MSFIAKNPLSVVEATDSPPAPIAGTKGLFPKSDGWYSIDKDGVEKKLLDSDDMAGAVSSVNGKVGDVVLKAEDIGAYSKEETDSKLSTVYKYKGTIDYYFQLPTDSEVGDVYNIRYASSEKYDETPLVYRDFSIASNIPPFQDSGVEGFCISIPFGNKPSFMDGDKLKVGIYSDYYHSDMINFEVPILDSQQFPLTSCACCATDVDYVYVFVVKSEAPFNGLANESAYETFYEQLYNYITNHPWGTDDKPSLHFNDEMMYTFKEPYLVSAGDNVAWTGTEWDVLAGTVDMNLYEQTSNKVTAIDENSTDTQYPSAKAVWHATQTLIEGVNETYVTKNSFNEQTELFKEEHYDKTETDGKLESKADKTDIPTKVSELENDTGYLTEHQDISGKVDIDLSNVANDVFKAKAESAGVGSGSDSVDLSGYEKLTNKTTKINADSTDEQYPTAKATYDFVNNQIKPLEDCFDAVVSPNILPPDSESGYYDNSFNKLDGSRYARMPEPIVLDANQTNLYVYSKTKLTNEKDTLIILYANSDGSFVARHTFASAISDMLSLTIPTGAVSFVAYIQNYTYSGLTMDDFCISYSALDDGYVPYGNILRLSDKIKDKTFYVSTNGSDQNDGLSPDTPFATVQKAFNSNAHNIAIERGTYFMKGILNFKDKNDIHIYAYDNDETYSHDSPHREKVNLVGGTYHSDYAKNEDGIYVCEGLTANRLTLIDNEDAKATILTSVSSYEDVKTTDNSFYSDGTNLYFNTSNETFEKIAIPKYNYILTFDNCNNVLVEDIACNVAIKGVVSLNNCSGITFNNCEANYSQADMGFALTNTNATFNNCTAYRNRVDGFSYHGYGTTVMNECISKWNTDDGCSHHYGCIGTINGGRFTGNGKCGITPAYGANVSIYNAICDQNDNGGIGYLSTDNGHAPTKGVVNGCLMMNNTGYGFRTNSLCEVIMLNCKFKDNSSGEINNQGTLLNLDSAE